jgi:hypothetical protein
MAQGEKRAFGKSAADRPTSTPSLPGSLGDRLGVQVIETFGGGEAHPVTGASGSAQRLSSGSDRPTRPAHHGGAWLPGDSDSDFDFDNDDDYDDDQDDVMWTHNFEEDDVAYRDDGDGDDADKPLAGHGSQQTRRTRQKMMHAKEIQTTLSVCAALMSGT